MGDQILVGVPGQSGGRVHRFRNDKTAARAVLESVHSQTGRDANEGADVYGVTLAVGDFDGSDSIDFAVGATGEAPGTDPASGAAFVQRTNASGTFVKGAMLTQTD